MKSKKNISEIIKLLNYDPYYIDYSDTGISTAAMFAAGPVKIIDPERDKKELKEFNENLALVEDKFIEHYDTCSYSIRELEEQQLVIEDVLAETKRRNKREYKDAGGVTRQKMAEVIELGETVLDKIGRVIRKKKLESDNKIDTDNQSTFDFERDGFTPELLIGKTRVKLNGAELAFYLQLFNDVGWFPDFEGKKLGKVFTNILMNNFEHLKDGEYQQLKDFNERFSQVGHIRQEKSNNKKLNGFKKILSSTINRAKQQFLSDEDNHDLMRD